MVLSPEGVSRWSAFTARVAPVLVGAAIGVGAALGFGALPTPGARLAKVELEARENARMHAVLLRADTAMQDSLRYLRRDVQLTMRLLCLSVLDPAAAARHPECDGYRR